MIDVITSSGGTSPATERDNVEQAPQSTSAHGPSLLENETDPARLKTLKLGSTYIREWLNRQRQEGRDPSAGIRV